MALSKPLVEGKTKLKLQFTTLGTKRVLPLNNYNVEQIFKTVSLTTRGRYGGTLGWYLDIPSSHYSDPVSSAESYIKGLHHSWRRIIYCLDCVDKTSVADELIPYTEPPADPSLTVQRVTPIFLNLRDWVRFVRDIAIPIPDARLAVIGRLPSLSEQCAQLSFYYVYCCDYASWTHLAMMLYSENESAAAIKMFKSQLPKPQDPTLTPENVLAELQKVQLWGSSESLVYLDMPHSTHDNLIRRHGDGAPGKSALVNEYLSQHPYPRWGQIVQLLEENGKARARRLAQEVKDKYMTMSQEEAQAVSQVEAQEIVDKALESGSLKQRNMITVITGIMGAGKTCLLRALFGLKPHNKYTSTGVAEKSFRGLMHHIAKMGSFELLKQEEVHEFLAPLLSSGMSEASIVSLARNFTEEEIEDWQDPPSDSSASTSSFLSLSPYSESTESVPHPKSVPSLHEPIPSLPHSPASSLPASSLPSSQSATQPIPDKSYSCKAMTSALRAKMTSKEALVLELIHMIDTGGQPEFMEVMPCLVHNSNLTLLVLNLAQPLDAYPKVTFHQHGKGYMRPLPSPLTSRQTIRQLARTMQAKRCIKVGDHGSKLMVIGTHRDCIWPWKVTATLAAVNMELKKIFIPAFQKELIVYRSIDDIIFSVNTRRPGSSDKRVFKLIRQNISDAAEGREIDIPPSFLMFEQDAIRYAGQLGRDILSFDECMQIGVPLKMPEKVVQAALIYFHQHNIFLYFPKVLPKLVFTNPQIPLDFVNEVVAFSYMVGSGAYPGLPAEYAISLKSGVLLEEMLHREPLSSCFVPGVYESQQAIALFTHLSVIAPLREDNQQIRDKISEKDGKTTSIQQKYLMPCMLPDLKNIANILPRSPVEVFIVRFSDDCAPNGVFGGSLSTLLSSHGWEICRKDDGSPQCLAHNIVTLHDPKMPAQITYVNATRHYEVHVKAHDIETCADICPTIRNTIFCAIRATFEVMHFDETIEDAFLCPCKENASLSHAALPCTFHRKVHLKCSISGESLGPADDKHKVWLSAEPTTPAQPRSQAQPQKPKERLPATEDRPTLPQLIDFKTCTGNMNVTERIGTSYGKLGPLLLRDDDGAVTQAIRDQYHHDAAKINQEILQRWIQGKGKGMQPVQWSTLIDVLKKIELSPLAKEIEDNLQ